MQLARLLRHRDIRDFWLGFLPIILLSIDISHWQSLERSMSFERLFDLISLDTVILA